MKPDLDQIVELLHDYMLPFDYLVTTFCTDISIFFFLNCVYLHYDPLSCDSDVSIQLRSLLTFNAIFSTTLAQTLVALKMAQSGPVVFKFDPETVDIQYHIPKLYYVVPIFDMW